MTTSTTEFSETESVYQTHKARIEAARNDVPVSGIVDQIKTYTNTKISNDDVGYVKCSTIDDLDIICGFISANENVIQSRVYPALRLIGYNDRYHQFKLDKHILFEDRAVLIKRCKLALNRNIVEMMSTTTDVFKGTRKKTYRIDKMAVAVTVKDAERYNIKTSDLNLYYALHGLRILVANEPDYMLLKDHEYFVGALTTLSHAEDSVKWNIQTMETMLDNYMTA